MKDEHAGTPIAEYVGLRPKLYSIMKGDKIKYDDDENTKKKDDDENTKKKEDEKFIKKAKGIKKYVVKKHISFEDYKDALFNKQNYTHEMNMLRSKRHRVYGITVNKKTLSPLDTKRFIAPDGITTYAYGYSQYQPEQ